MYAYAVFNSGERKNRFCGIYLKVKYPALRKATVVCTYIVNDFGLGKTSNRNLFFDSLTLISEIITLV